MKGRKGRLIAVRSNGLLNAIISKLANRIADDLFTEGGTDRKAQRLVLEFKSGTFAGTTGWCKTVVIDRIKEIMRYNLSK
jgi:hypothetical protein